MQAVTSEEMINLLVFSDGEKHYTEHIHHVSDVAQEAALALARLVLDGGQADVAPVGELLEV